MDPDITVVMLCYNAMPYIADAIDSILCQTYSDFLLYIIYDDSDDGTYDYLTTIEDKRVKIEHNKYGKGLMNARNYALDIAQTKYVAIMDADDIAVSNRLEIEHKYLENNPNVAAVGGLAQIIDKDGNKGQICGTIGKNANEVKAVMFFENTCPNGTMMYRNSIVRSNNIRYRAKVIEDYMFWCDLANKGQIVILSDLLMYYRVWDNNSSATLLGGMGSIERQKWLNYIHRELFRENGFVVKGRRGEKLLDTLKEDTSPPTMIEAIANLFNYSSLIKQAKNKNNEWSNDFIKVCKIRRLRDIKNAIKAILIK